MLQIINVVVPTFQSMLGCLWPYSTAKLEARGARVKPIVRRCIHASFVLMYTQCTYVYPPLHAQANKCATKNSDLF